MISTVSKFSWFLILTLSYSGGFFSLWLLSSIFSTDLNLVCIGLSLSADVSDKNFESMLSSNQPHRIHTFSVFMITGVLKSPVIEKLNINLSVSLTINCRTWFVPTLSDTGVSTNSFAFIVVPSASWSTLSAPLTLLTPFIGR